MYARQKRVETGLFYWTVVVEAGQEAGREHIG